MIRCPACGATNRVPEAKLAQGLRPVCGRCKRPLPVDVQPAVDGRPLKVTDATFATEVERSPLPVVVDLWAPWCPEPGERALARRDRPVACDQVLYHLQERAIEHAVMPWCERHGAALVAYSPFGSGNFPGPRTKGGRVLQEIAAAHDATSRQVALRFLVRRPSTFAIPKSSNPEHTAENAGAGDLRLSEDELARIDSAFPRGRPRSRPML